MGETGRGVRAQLGYLARGLHRVPRYTTDTAAWMDGIEFNAPVDTVKVISEAVFIANHLTDTDKQNSTGKYR